MTQPENTAQLLRDALHAHVVQVQFRKADGSLRVMKATLRVQDLPVRTGVALVSEPDLHVFKVWDVDLQAWRSFRTDRLVSWTLTPHE